MGTARKTAAKRKQSAAPKDAIALLKADHATVSELFSNYEKARTSSRKKGLVNEICTALTVHARIEEELFYPEVKRALKDTELVPEATVEHASLKDLIAQIEGKEPDGEMFDAKVKVLCEYVKHHVKEEQNEMFPKVRKSSLDLVEMGQRLSARKAELMSGRGR